MTGAVERSLITSHRSVTHGRQRAPSVRKQLHLWSTLANSVSVRILFLLVSALHCRRCIDLIVIQARYIPPVFQTWTILSKWDLINPCYPTHTNTIGPRLQCCFIRATHLRYARFAFTYFFQDANSRGQMYVWNSYP